MSNRLRIGMVGYKFMGKAHSNAYRSLPMFFPDAPLQPEMSVICGRNARGFRRLPSSSAGPKVLRIGVI